VHGRDVYEALVPLRDLVAMELSHRSDRPRPLFAMVVPIDVPVPTGQPDRGLGKA
jgi:hypothetical protein